VDRKIKIVGQLELLFELCRLMFQGVEGKKKTRQSKCFCEEEKQQNIKKRFWAEGGKLFTDFRFS